MGVVIDANFIIATCAVFGVMCTIFGFFWKFVISPVIKGVSEAVVGLGLAFKEKMGDHDSTLAEHNRRITDQERVTAVMSTKLSDHIEKEA
jgi:hypothetical protein